MRVRWSPHADIQVDEAVEYLARDNPTAALDWLDEVLDRVAGLASFPDSGRMVPETQREDIREVIVGPYRVMYRRKDDLVEIVAVRHQACEFDETKLRP